MPEPTVEQLMTMDKISFRKSSAVGPLVVFFLLPPLGVYLLWKEKAFHKTFAMLSLILGIANVFSGVSIYLSIPKFGILLVDRGLTQSTDTTFVIFYLIISIAQVVLSYFLWKNAKRRELLLTWELILLSIMTILVDFIILPLLIGGFILNTLLPIFQQNLDPYKNFPIN